MIQNILLRKIILSLLILVIARIGIFIPISGIDHDTFRLAMDKNTFVNFLNIFSGGGFSTIGIFALGIVPYINASLIMQLLSKMLPALEALQKEEGDVGRQKITQLTRLLTLFWAVVQSLIVAFWIKPYVFSWDLNFLIETVLCLSAGSVTIMWLSEKITEKGIGNGASLLIFQNIVSGIPNNLKTSINTNFQQEVFITKVIPLTSLFILMLVVTILVQEGMRKITIISARQLSQKTEIYPQSYLPLKINHGGVMPLIFASASMTIPAYIQSILPNSLIKKGLSYFLSTSSLYVALYGILIFGFSYFYSSLILNTGDMTKNLKKMGASIPGIRPGQETHEYLIKVINRLTCAGSVFLFLIALVPYIIPLLTGISTFQGLGATSLLILVGVSIDTAKQIQTYIIAEQYKNMME